MTRVVVVEDHPLYRQALVSLVGEVDGFEVVAEAADGLSGVAATVEHQPDVVLMDLGLPDLSGIEATRQIRALLPSTAVLVLTMTEDEAAVSGAVRAGAAGYLVKGAEPEAIARALAAVAEGGAVFGAQVAGAALSRLGRPAPAVTTPGLRGLTTREIEVLDLVAAGQSNAAIAAELDISAKTVRNHLSNILVKIGVRDRSAAIVKARESGLGT